MKLSTALTTATLLTAGTIIGVSAQQFASADISAGDRPVLVPIEPCRLVDTRPGDATVGPRDTPLGAAETLSIAAQEAETDCTGDIPAAALSLSLNVTAIGASDVTFLTIWTGGNRPNASSLNPAPGEPPTPNAVTVDLSVDQAFEIYNNAGTLNLVVDVNGYYENHDHDDRYPTRDEVTAQVDAAVAELVDEDPFLAVIRMSSGSDGYAVEQGTDPGLTINAVSPSVFEVGSAAGSTRSLMESATCTSGFSGLEEFGVFKEVVFAGAPTPVAEIHLIQPDGTPLSFNGRAVYCTLWER